MPRRKTKHFLPYDEAKQYTQKNQIKSRSQYWDWVKTQKVGFLPMHPHKHYEEWQSWNTFLNTSNSFEDMTHHPKQFRPYWDAVRWAQKYCAEHKITTQREWMDHYSKVELPRDIPKRPDQYYDEFTGRGWGVWMGSDARGKVMSEQQNIAVLALCTMHGAPLNMIKVIIEKDGIHALKETLVDNQLRAVRVYMYVPQEQQMIEQILSANGTDQGDHVYIIPNMNTLLFDMDSSLEFYKA